MTGPAAVSRTIRRRPAAKSYSSSSDRRGAAASGLAASRYSFVPERHRRDPGARAELQRKLLDAIAGALDHQGYCYLSITALASRVGSMRLPVSIELGALKYAGILCRWQDQDGRFATVIVDSGGGCGGDCTIGLPPAEEAFCD